VITNPTRLFLAAATCSNTRVVFRCRIHMLSTTHIQSVKSWLRHPSLCQWQQQRTSDTAITFFNVLIFYQLSHSPLQRTCRTFIPRHNCSPSIPNIPATCSPNHSNTASLSTVHCPLHSLSTSFTLHFIHSPSFTLHFRNSKTNGNSNNL